MLTLRCHLFRNRLVIFNISCKAISSMNNKHMIIMKPYWTCIFVSTRRHHEWCSSLWLKFFKKGPISPTFLPNKRRWERDCNIPSRAQRCFKKFFLSTEKSYFLKLSQKQPKRVNETTTNQQDVVLKMLQREIDYHTFNCWCNFQCWLFSL